jgi:hypothetical protein
MREVVQSLLRQDDGGGKIRIWCLLIIGVAEGPADSLCTDIPKDEVSLLQRRLPEIKYVDTGTPERIDVKPLIDVVNEALKSAGKN